MSGKEAASALLERPRGLVIVTVLYHLGRPAPLKELVAITKADDQTLARACKNLEELGLIKRHTAHSGWGLTLQGKNGIAALPALIAGDAKRGTVSPGGVKPGNAAGRSSQKSVISPTSEQRNSQKPVKSPNYENRNSQKPVNSPVFEERNAQKSVNPPKNEQNVVVNQIKDLVVNDLKTTNHQQKNVFKKLTTTNNKKDIGQGLYQDQHGETDENGHPAAERKAYNERMKQADYEHNLIFFKQIGILPNKLTDALARKCDPQIVHSEWRKLRDSGQNYPGTLICILKKPEMQVSWEEYDARNRRRYTEWDTI